MNAGRVWAYAGATLAIAASIAANVAHALLASDPPTGSVVLAAFWPVALFFMIEIVARVDWPNGRAMTNVIRFLGGTLVGSVAAVVSYRHLSGLLASYGEDPLTVVIGPLGVDGLALVSLAALIVTRPTQAPAGSTPVDRVADQPSPTIASPTVSPSAPVGEVPALPKRPVQSPRPTRPTAKPTDHDLRARVEQALKVGQLQRPLTEKAVRDALGIGATKARQLRNEFNHADRIDPDASDDPATHREAIAP